MKTMRDEIVFMTSDQKEKDLKSQTLLNQVAVLPDGLTRLVCSQTYKYLYTNRHTETQTHVRTYFESSIVDM